MHHRDVCATHGVTLAQCRCPGPKEERKVPCPGSGCPGTKDAPVEVHVQPMEPMAVMTRPQDWAPRARAILWPERTRG